MKRQSTQTTKENNAEFAPKHIDYVVVARTHPPRYSIHRYWARKPHNVVSTYIQAYSRPGEVVLDPFAGSGVTALEAIASGRRAISADLNPLSEFLARVTARRTSVKQVEDAFDEVRARCETDVRNLYTLTCPKCHKNPAILEGLELSYVVACPKCHADIIMGQAKRAEGKRQNIYCCPQCAEEFSYGNQPLKGEVGTRARYKCVKCGAQEFTGPKSAPILISPSVTTPFWGPTQPLSYPNGSPFLTARRVKTVQDLFTKRNLAALSIILNAIRGIKERDSRECLLLAFSAAVPQGSRMMIWTEGSGPSWKVPEYLVYPLHWELNCWTRFENRIKSFIRGRDDANKTFGQVRFARDYDDLKGEAQLLLKTASSIDLNFLPNESIDYVFTDPPYGGAIQYFELDVMRLAWISDAVWGSGSNSLDWWKDEITINAGQKKDFDYYHAMLRAAFGEVYRVLRPGRFLTVTFHSTDIQVYNSIVQAVVFSGFQLEKIVYQPPAVTSAKAQLQPYGSAVGDYYLRFSKPTARRKLAEPETVTEAQFRNVVVQSAKKIIAERGEPTTYQDILKGIYTELDKHGLLLAATPEKIDHVMQAAEGQELVFLKDSGWWFSRPEEHFLHVVPLADRVERVVIQALKHRVLVSFEEILQELFLKFPNALTPSPKRVREILEEYAEQTAGKWRLKAVVRKREDEHMRVLKDLVSLGRRIGYETWAGHLDSELRKVVVPRLKIPVAASKLKRIKEIDVIWLKKDKPVAIFEVEHTTGIAEAVIRGSHVEGDVERYMVLPDERKRFLERRLEEPILRENIEKYGWQFLFFDALEEFVNSTGKKKLTHQEFKALVGRRKKQDRSGQGELF